MKYPTIVMRETSTTPVKNALEKTAVVAGAVVLITAYGTAKAVQATFRGISKTISAIPRIRARVFIKGE